MVNRRYKKTILDTREYMVTLLHAHELPLSQLEFIKRPSLELLSNYFDLKNHFPQEPSAELNHKLKEIAQVGDFYNVFLIKVTPEGRNIVVASGEPEYIGRDYTRFFKLNPLNTPLTQQVGYATYIFFDDKTFRPRVIIVEPIFSPDEKKMIGMLLLSKEVTEQLYEILQPQTHFYEVHFALLLPSTIVIASTDPKLRFKYFLPLDREYRELFIRSEPHAGSSVSSEPLPLQNESIFPFFEFYWQGEEQIGYIHRAERGNYELLAYASKKDVYELPLISFFNVYSIYGLILIAGGVAATFVTMRMAKPIQDLSMVMQKIQEGNLNVRYTHDFFGFEINALGQHFQQYGRCRIAAKTYC